MHSCFVSFAAGGLAAVAIAAGPGAGDPAFSEHAVELGMGTPHAAEGYAHSTYTGGGVVADFNNDGYQDLFVISGGVGDRPDRLFINDGDGTFTESAADWGLTTIHLGKGASVADFNDDGFLDLYVTSAGPVGAAAPGHHKLYRNNGNSTFTNIAGTAGVNQTAAVEDGFGSGWGDYDLDGDLDLFVAGFANNNSGNRLFQNNGDETFTDVTSDIGFFNDTPIQMRSFTPRFVDMNGDWYPEMLLVSDFGTTRYFRNDGDGTFTDITVAANVGQDENGMGQTTGDFNNDGLIDWYVTSIYQPAIGWTGNKLYFNAGNHHYNEIAELLGVDDGGYGWGALSVDFNHDGRLDIAETNGDSGGQFSGEQAYLWVQQPNLTFTEMAVATGFIHNGSGRGMSNFDYDNDGDQDAVIFANNERLYLFRNDLVHGADTNWLRVFLDTSGSPGLAPNGIGARVWATTGEDTQLRYICSGDNFESHSELSAHFGLGTATVVDELRVGWPDGTETILADVSANRTITVAPFPVGDLNQDGTVDTVDFLMLLADWGPCPAPCPPACTADLDGNCTVDTADFLTLLSSWT